MNILELDSYNLADAVKFNDKLNPRIWQGEKMKPQVRAKLLQIAEDFKQSLGLSDLEVKDITVSGSNAGYTYTPNSDIDLHLVIDLPQADASEVYRELFDAKKFQYNETHNITIGGYDVELYVENANQPPVSQGMYSVVNDDWINIPKKRRATVDDNAVKSKYEVMKHRIESAIASKNFKRLTNTAAKIKKMRQAGLDRHGELGPENLAYKMLRTQGKIKALYDARTAAQDKKLSLKEQPRPRVTYGFAEDVGITPDGVSPSTKMFLSETDDEQTVADFIKSTAEFLGIERLPTINLHSDPDWGEQNQSFGRYDPDSHELHVNLANRHIMDVLRTTAHELAHCRQHEIKRLPLNAGDTGSPWENEAHAVAGIVMRNYADQHPEMFQGVDLNENASGYIPKNKKEARDPRYSMAVTVDIKPGQVGKEANKLALNTGKNGEPALLMKSANLQESLAAEFTAFSEAKSYGYNSTPLSQVPGEREDELGNQEATGPEFPPQMPAGTTKIDVSDLTDWYRLGMDISDMDDADPADYNQGPPQTVITFPSDEAEQGYLKQFKRLGLKTHDMDPDVEGGEDVTGKHMKELEEDFALLEQEFLGEVKMTSGNLAKLVKDIKGAKVGLEFEMIVPNATIEDDGDMEPDYDRDERVRDINEAVGFFDDGDYNGHRQLRDLRSAMQESYWEWRSEALDHEWYNGDGFEYFTKWLEDNDSFDEEEAEEEARNQLQSEYGDELDVEEFEKMLFALVDEKRASYVQEQWDDQSVNFDDARQEYEDERIDDYSEEDWLRDQGIRFASDVESNFGHVTWPYYTSNSNQGETDIKRIALEFMNDSGLPYDNIAIANSYHGRYELWDGNQWIDYGSDKPDFCFAVEPDGSLDGNDSDDAGLEFVSPPIPLDQVGDVMSKVQQWAAANGVYTGKANKTSMHTNISVPGYDLKNLDYLKAALLLGDEYVLREFDRIGNTYAKPAIEKVKQLVNQKPEKAKELLDKMKSHLNAEASKLIHSGITDKFTSINTKNNRIEFRSPGGDYLSNIADNPQKMQDTINRMVVTMDAAMDPNKYKQEYQKKLYKMLTGQQSGREAKTGAKQEMKKDDKDLLNLFSRYAAGELPRAALKSFVRQAQLERKGKKADAALASHNWAIRRRDGGDIVRTFQADNYMQAFDILQQYKQKHNITDDSLTYGPYNREDQQPAQQPQTPQYELYNHVTDQVIDTFPAQNDEQARTRLRDYINYGEGQSAPGDFAVRRAPVPGSTLDLQRRRAAQAQQTPNYYIRSMRNDSILELFYAPNEKAAGEYVSQYSERETDRGNYPGPIAYRAISSSPRAQEMLAQQQATNTQQSPGASLNGRASNPDGNYVIVDSNNDATPVYRFMASGLGDATTVLRQWEEANPGTEWANRFDPDQSLGQPGAAQPAQPNQGNWGIWIVGNNRFANQPGTYARGAEVPLYRFPSQAAAESWLEQQRAERAGLRTDIEVREIEPTRTPVANIDLFPDMEADLARARAADATQRGETEYIIFNMNDRSQLTGFRAANQAEAEREAESILRDLNLDPDQYDVRERNARPIGSQQAGTSDAAQGGIVDVAGEPATGSEVGQTYNPTGTGSFTGQWLVLDPNNRVIYRFGGIGNNQSDANRLAMAWLQQNPRQMVNGVSVVPEMG